MEKSKNIKILNGVGSGNLNPKFEYPINIT